MHFLPVLFSVVVVTTVAAVSSIQQQLFAVKEYEPAYFLAGHPTTVNYRIMNIGTTKVKDIELVDSTFINTTMFEIIDGGYPLQLPELPKQSNNIVSLTFIPKHDGQFIDVAARIKYFRLLNATTTDGGDEEVTETYEEGEGFSKPRGSMRVLTREEFHLEVAIHPWQWVIIFTALTLVFVIPYRKHLHAIKEFHQIWKQN